jgi:hypothetical protein
MPREKKNDSAKTERDDLGDDQGTRVGHPNPEGDERTRTEEHKGSYGGEKGEPRTPAQDR